MQPINNLPQINVLQRSLIAVFILFAMSCATESESSSQDGIMVNPTMSSMMSTDSSMTSTDSTSTPDSTMNLMEMGHNDNMNTMNVDPSMTQPPPTPPAQPVESCDALMNSQSCFGNIDCPADQACIGVGTDELPVACCVSGGRGQGVLGDTCSADRGEFECQSGICIADLNSADPSLGLCSEVCDTPSDCPVSLPRCIPIAFSNSDHSWCFPAGSSNE